MSEPQFLVEKFIRFQIEGEDAETLKDICELARRHIDMRKVLDSTGTPTVDEYDARQTNRIQTLMTRIFDA